MSIANVDLVYTGRSGKFKHGKTYKSSLDVYGREGSESPDTWIYKIRIGWFKGYRVTPYEFSKYWRHLDTSRITVLMLKVLYRNSGNIMRDLVYRDNPFLRMIPQGESFQGAYFPVPFVYCSNPGYNAVVRLKT